MCLAVPGRVVDKFDDRGTPMASIDFGGIVKTVCLGFTPEAEVGDYALVHAGFAITVLDETAAEESLALFEAMETRERGDDR